MRNKYIENLRKAIINKGSRSVALHKAVLEVAISACKEAIEKFPSLTRIVLVGSIVSGGFSKKSDTDIVITGLDKKDYFRLASFMEDKIGRHIDLIMEEDLSATDKTHILKRKKVVYDSKKH